MLKGLAIKSKFSGRLSIFILSLPQEMINEVITVSLNRRDAVVELSDFPSIDDEAGTIVNEVPAQSSTYKRMLKLFSCDKEAKEKVLIPSAIESVVTYTSAAVVTPFISQNASWYWHPFAASSFVLSSNLLNRMMARSKLVSENERLLWMNLMFRSYLYANFNMIFTGTLIHEFGHVIAFLVLYNNTHPFINITLPDGAYAQNINGTINELGLMLGENKTSTIVSASGAGHVMLWAYGGMLATQFIPDDYPELKMHIRLSAIFFVLKSALYALSALWSCEPRGHDFCNMEEKGGIHPLAAVGFIVGSALMVQLFLSCTTAYCAKNKKENQEVEVEDLSGEQDLSNEQDLSSEQDVASEQDFSSEEDEQEYKRVRLT